MILLFPAGNLKRIRDFKLINYNLNPQRDENCGKFQLYVYLNLKNSNKS